MAYGVTDEGFKLKRLEQILLELRQDALAIFQDLLEPTDVLDTSDSSTLGRWINLISIPEAEQWENGQLVYSAFDPNTATGVALDNLIELTGIPKRRAATYSNTTGVVTGDLFTVIPQNSLVGSSVNPYTFRTSQEVVLSATPAVGIVVDVSVVLNTTPYTITYSTVSGSNTVTYTSDSSATAGEILEGLRLAIVSSHPELVATIVPEGLSVQKVSIFSASNFTVSANLSIVKASKTVSLIASDVGEIPAESGTINVIKTPVIGWDSVNNPLSVTLGSLTETDEELRLRFYNSRFERATNTLDAIYSALVNLEGVESVFIYENDTDVVDSLGQPPHSFTVVVLGGDSEEIANTIWENKPIGILSNGGEAVTIFDVQGFPHIIKFTRPSPVNIYISMTLETYIDYPSDGASRIRSEILDFARENFGVGEDIVFSRLYTPINSVEGHSVTDLRIGTSPSPTGQANIPIDFDEIGNFNSVNIIITEVPVTP